MKKFKSDGCTWFPEGNWHECCVEHDKAYFKGGSKKQRLKADISLLSCVSLKGHPYISVIMFLGVRFFGHPYWPHRIRWGYGRKYFDSCTYARSENKPNKRRKR